MKDINNYIQEKLYIDKDYKNILGPDELRDEIINIIMEDHPLHAGKQTDKTTAVNRINKWIYKYNVNKIEYLTNFDYKNSNFEFKYNLDMLKDLNTTYDEDKFNEIENEIVSNNKAQYFKYKDLIKIHGDSTCIGYTSEYLYIGKQMGKKTWISLIIIKK